MHNKNPKSFLFLQWYIQFTSIWSLRKELQIYTADIVRNINPILLIHNTTHTTSIELITHDIINYVNTILVTHVITGHILRLLVTHDACTTLHTRNQLSHILYPYIKVHWVVRSYILCDNRKCLLLKKLIRSRIGTSTHRIVTAEREYS